MYKLDIHSPKTLEKALELKNIHGNMLHSLAGGTDVLVSLRSNRVDWGSKPSLLNLNNIEDLHFVTETRDTVEIGPLLTHNELTQNPLIKEHIPTLCKALTYIGSPQIRNQGTIGGNIVHASPAADSLPVLYMRDTKIEVSTYQKRTLVPIQDFITGPGSVELDPYGIVTKILVPKHSGYRGDYQTLRQRKAISINVVSVGSEILMSDEGRVEDIRIALGAVSPTVVRGEKTERYLQNKKLSHEIIGVVKELIQKECIPIDDIRSKKKYRSAMTGVLLSRFLRNQI